MRVRRYPAASASDRSTSNSRDLVLELEGAEEAGVRLDAEPALSQRGTPPVLPVDRTRSAEPGRLVLPFRVTVPSTAPPLKAEPRGRRNRTCTRRGEGGGGGPQDPAHLLLDLAAVPVGERQGPAGPLADLERAEVEIGADRGGGQAAGVLGGQVDPRRPPGDFEGEVVAGPGGQPARAVLMTTRPASGPSWTFPGSSHGPTVKGRAGKGLHGFDGVTYVPMAGKG